MARMSVVLELCFVSYLWLPCIAEADIIFVPVFFSLFSSPNLNGRRVDIYYTSTHGVALV